jgi:hypothetical protein
MAARRAFDHSISCDRIEARRELSCRADESELAIEHSYSVRPALELYELYSSYPQPTGGIVVVWNTPNWKQHASLT